MTPPTHWQKSSFSSGGSGDDCVELAASPLSPRMYLRESDDPAAVLATDLAAVRDLLEAVKRGRL
jgi:hypothetical protein